MGRASAGQPRRRTWLTSVVLGACAIVLLAAGWVAAMQFESPAQRAATAKAPKAGHVLAKVTTGAVSDRVSSTGTVTSVSTTAVTTDPSESTAVITARTAASGDEASNGSVVAEINGAPVFVLSGQFAFYRDLRRGSKGPDVLQLNQALAELGLLPAGDVGTTFGQPTATAVASLFRHAGYSAPGTVSQGTFVVEQSLPATIRAVQRVGAQVSSSTPLVTLSRGDEVVKTPFPAATTARLRPGMSATITPADGGGTIDGRIQTVGAGSVTVTPNEPLPATAYGRRAVVIVTISSVDGSQLLVPTIAVATKSDGEASILVERSGRLRTMSVKVVGTLNGLTAVDATGLRVGDEVAVD